MNTSTTNLENITFEEAAGKLQEKLSNRIIPWGPDIYGEPEEILTMLGEKGIRIEKLRLDVKDFKDYLYRADYKSRREDIYKDHFLEKTLEHFIGFKLLNLKKNDVFIDIAGAHSPVAEIFEDLSGCIAYSHDIIYQEGINNKKIGSDAGDIPLSNCSVNGAIAACSIEHFEGVTDILWMKEMSRLLKKHGKVIVVPLYINTYPYFVTDPFIALESDVCFDDKEFVVYARQGYANRHGRFYSPKTLVDRLLKPNSDSMDFTIYFLENFKEIDKSIYCRFLLEGKKKK